MSTFIAILTGSEEALAAASQVRMVREDGDGSSKEPEGREALIQAPEPRAGSFERIMGFMGRGIEPPAPDAPVAEAGPPVVSLELEEYPAIKVQRVLTEDE